jgi:putative flippase GtrA
MKADGALIMNSGRPSLSGWIGNQNLIGFFCIGIISSFVDIGLLVFFCSYLGIWYLSAAAVSYSFGIVNSYVLNKYLNFHDHDRHILTQFTTFATISFSCLMVNLCVIWLCVEQFSLNYITAKIIATFCAFFWNYHGQKRFTFREGS